MMKSFKRTKEAFTNVFDSYLNSNTNFSTISSLQTGTSPKSLSKNPSRVTKLLCTFQHRYLSALKGV